MPPTTAQHRPRFWPFRLAAVTALALCGCGKFSSRVILDTRPQYNEVVNRTGEEQMLLNLVRLQYDDLPSFLQISTVSAQFTLRANAGFNVTGAAAAQGLLQLGSEYVESPTITYQPLQGEDFVNTLLRRIPATMLVTLQRGNWPADVVFKLLVHDLGGLHNLPTKAPVSPERLCEYDEFKQVLALMQDLLYRGVIDLDTEAPVSSAVSDALRNQPAKPAKTDDPSNQAAATTGQPATAARPAGAQGASPSSPQPQTGASTGGSKPGGDTAAKPGNDGKSDIDADAPLLRLAKQQHQAEWCTLLDKLKACPATCAEPQSGDRLQSRCAGCCGEAPPNSIYFFTSTRAYDPRLAGIGHIIVTTRTLAEVMMSLSGGVAIPEGYAHGVQTARCDDLAEHVEHMNELFHVYCSAREPVDAAVSVRYRGYWFFIKTSDARSRRIFAIVRLLFQNQLQKAIQPLGPTLTIPASR